MQFQLIPLADAFQSGLRFGGSSDFDAYEEVGCRSGHIVLSGSSIVSSSAKEHLDSDGGRA